MIVSVTVTNSREAEISDAIQSVVDHVDKVLLVDTGIKDRTAKLAQEIAGDKFRRVKHKWVDFSKARNAGIKAAKKMGGEWAVIVDSDERLNFGGFDLRATLARTRADVIMIRSADGHYPKERVLRVASKLHYVGPTHEALIGGARETIDGPTFFELSKSGWQLAQKFARDVTLLSAYVKEHPDDGRWWYYLGASYEGIGDISNAAKAFGECVARRKMGDEAAWAAFRQAEQLVLLERFDEAIRAAGRGLAANVYFGECAWIAGVAAYRAGRNDQAIAWARVAEAVGCYKGCGTVGSMYFRELSGLYELPYDILRYALTDEKAKQEAETDFYAAKRARLRITSGGVDLDALDPLELDRLSVSRAATGPGRTEARSMLRPPPLWHSCPSMKAVQIQFKPPEQWYPMNPSVCLHKGELWCVVRTVNYSLRGNSYTVHDDDRVVRTENYLGRLDPENGKLIEPKQMRDFDRATERQRSGIVGYEDLRLVSIKGPEGDVLTGSATVCDYDPNRRLIARIYIDDDGNVERAEVQRTNQMHEKNWMPLSVNGEFTWIYSIDPTTILPGPLRNCKFALEHLRGGAAIGFGDGYLCVTHETVDTDEGRIYLHRFVRLDEKFNVTAVSPAWIFSHHGIEFCAGLAEMRDELVLTYGIDDREAWVARISAKELEAMDWIKS